MTIRQQPGWMRRTLRSVRCLAWLLLGAMALAFGGWRLGLEYVNELIRSRACEMLAQRYPRLEIGIRSARRTPGLGIELTELSVRDPEADSRTGPILFVDEILIRCDVSFETLLSGRVVPEQVVVRRPRLRAECDLSGKWNVASLWSFAATGQALPPVPLIVVEDGMVQARDVRQATAKPIALREVRLTARSMPSQGPSKEPTSRSGRFACEGTCVGEMFPRGAFRGELDADSGQWLLDGKLDDLRISPELATHLPAEMAGQLKPLAALRGRSDLTIRLVGQGGELNYAVAGKLYEGWIQDASLPYSLTDLNADFSCDREGLKIENATARSGVSQLRLDLIRVGHGESSPLTLRASTRQFSLDQRLPLVLPPALRSLWEKFVPAGTADVVLTLTFDGSKFEPEARIDCHDLAFTYEKFPYRVHGATGSLHLQHGELDIDLRIPISGKTTYLRGKLSFVGEKPTGWIEIETDGPVPIDEELFAALPAQPEEFLRTLHLQGMLELWGRFERGEADSKFHSRLELQVRGGSMRYDRFPYPLDRIQGSISVVDNRWSFTRLTGRNDSGHIVAQGGWDPDAEDQQHLKLDLQCSDIPLQESLRGALREDVRQLWSKLQPQGTIDHLTARIRYDRLRRDLDVEVLGQKWAPQQNIEGRTMTLRPTAFPYRLDNVTGAFHYRNGVVSLRDVQAEHSATRLKKLDGRCEHRPGGEWQLHFEKLDVEHLILDQDLLTALPPKLAQGLSKLNFRGAVSLAGEMRFHGTAEGGLRDSTWKLMVDTEDGQIDCGTKFEHIRGGGELSGAARDGSFACRGELRVDSMIFRGMHFTQVRGPLLIEPLEVTLGAWSQAPTNRNGLARNVTARTFGGELSLDARYSLAGDNRFDLLTHMTDADLGQVASAAGTTAASVSGKTFADLHLTGQAGVAESWRGAGVVRLFDADIYQLPLMVAMLKLLNVHPPDLTAFTKGDMRFRVEGDRVYFDRIALQGDAISLIGNGQINMQRQLDLDFYSVVGREDAQLPLFRPLFKEAARSVLLIKVGGSLNQPTVTPHPFPELNQTLQQLFPETSRLLSGEEEEFRP